MLCLRSMFHGLPLTTERLALDLFGAPFSKLHFTAVYGKARKPNPWLIYSHRFAPIRLGPGACSAPVLTYFLPSDFVDYQHLQQLRSLIEIARMYRRRCRDPDLQH
jgi:hypothetical protein